MPEPIADTTPTTAAAPPTPAPAPSVAPGASGVSTAAPVGQPAGATGSTPAPSFRDQLNQAAGQQTAPGQQQPTNMLGQPAAQGQAQPTQQATPATLESIVAQNPHLAPQLAALIQYAQQGYRAANLPQQPPAQQPAAPAGPKLNAFGVPEFDKRLLKFLFQTDPATGEQKPNPFAPPEILAQYEQYQDARRTAIESLLDSPEKLLGPMIEKFLTERAPAIADTRIQSVQEQSFARNYVAQNAGWLYQQTQQGQVARDPMGRPVLSQAGQLFEQTARQLQEMGVKDVATIQRLAEERVAGAMALQQLHAQRQAQQQSEAGKQNLLNSAQQFSAPPPGPQGQAQPQSFVPPQGQQPAGGTAFQMRNAMQQAAAANGVALHTNLI